MPRRNDLESICIIGSGPIVIGQAAEFDYAGCQALKVLREDGFRTIVVNSNPATIMTDPGFADRTYLEPLDVEAVADVLRIERPDALLPTMGGQTALNLARELSGAGVLDELGIELIGARLDAIERAEDRLKFKEAVESCGLKVPASAIVTSLDELEGLEVPAVVRPAFTLGGHGGGFAYTAEELYRQVERGLSESPIGQVLVEESVRGWDEFELEVVRDRIDNVVIVCSIENLDPMGVHTGDSVTVAPQMTLPDEAYQELRDAAAAVIRAVGVDTGGSNIQFARSRETGDVRVIEMNPRVSRSSALASKATGYPIAKVAARLAVGYTLDEIPNDLTGTTPASFEPTLDYVVVKFPRFAFEKFPGADRTLGTQMKSVGETMGIGRTFAEAFLKAYRSRELDTGAATPWQALAEVPDDVHPFFRRELDQIRAALDGLGDVDALVAGDWLRLKRLGLSDAAIAGASGSTETAVRQRRRDCGVRPAYRRVDSCAGEVEAASNYYYSTWGESDEPVSGGGKAATARANFPAGLRPSGGPPPTGARPRVVILGSGPNRIGQGIEFDYCCVHAVTTYRELGYEAVMVNCNPETVSTDYDTSDRLYFEPLDTESVLAICERERPEGVVIQFGGQTPLKLARAIEDAGYRILGTPFDAVDLAEDRERFAGLLKAHGLRSPEWGIAASPDEAVEIAERIGYPVLVRPSYVLGGRAMRVCYTADDVREMPRFASVLVDRFVENAVEVDVDALCDGTDTYVAAVMQHVEEAGVHSGDSACVLPAPSLSFAQGQEIARIVRILGKALGTVGLLNVQLAVTGDGDVYVIEANPRASRTVPFVSKATGVELVKAACRLAVGATIPELGLPPERPPRQWSVKAAVLPFARFPGSDPVLGPEMRSTGEVMASAADLSTALDKAERAAGRRLPRSGSVFISIREPDHQQAVPIAATLVGLGFELYATEGTAATLAAAGIAVEPVRKLSEAADGEPTVVDLIRRGRCDLVINTPEGRNARSDGYAIREAALARRVPCITTLSGAAAAVHAIATARAEQAVSLQ
ncbi:MAG TPA: carbamoyl-phosphate synthase large subunit, partial [Gaiellaceae bacterium]|nr:carbamoyl-phosphate synthase large subunit [Gaiellaceae bacterium]